MKAWRTAFVVLFWLVVPVTTRAQATPPHRFCLDPQRGNKCASYLVAEVSGSGRLAGTTTPDPACASIGPSYCRRELLKAFIAGDIGFMKNLDSTQSAGISFEGGGSDDGGRAAILARYRRWLTNRFVIEATGGPLMSQISAGLSGTQNTYGVTGDVGAGIARIGLVTLGFDHAKQLGVQATSIRMGVRFESRGLWIGGTAVAVGLAAVAAALGSIDY